MTEAHANSVLRYDPAFVSGSTNYVIGELSLADLPGVNRDDLVAIDITDLASAADLQIRRLTAFSGAAGQAPQRGQNTVRVVVASETRTVNQLSQSLLAATDVTFTTADNFVTGGALGSVAGSQAAPGWGLEDTEAIPEINLQVDSVSVTAITKKLKAKWTPELGQDLNAYHNLDAEVELTSILSEQIALEIDREIVEDLIKGATAGTYYWSRSPGLFVDRTTGAEVGAGVAAPDFTGTVSEWYETLGETINDVSAQIHRKTLRGGANFVVTSPEMAAILEFTAGFRANVTPDADRGTAGV
jgi:hypothetical protein